MRRSWDRIGSRLKGFARAPPHLLPLPLFTSSAPLHLTPRFNPYSLLVLACALTCDGRLGINGMGAMGVPRGGDDSVGNDWPRRYGYRARCWRVRHPSPRRFMGFLIGIATNLLRGICPHCSGMWRAEPGILCSARFWSYYGLVGVDVGGIGCGIRSGGIS